MLKHLMKVLSKHVRWPVRIAITNRKSSKALFLPEYIPRYQAFSTLSLHQTSGFYLRVYA